MTALEECTRRCSDFAIRPCDDDALVATWTMTGASKRVVQPRIIEATDHEWYEACARRALYTMVTQGPVWNETWDVTEDGIIVAGDGLTAQYESRFYWEQETNFGAFGPLGFGVPVATEPRDIERATLAAAAPEMARMLLRLQNSNALSLRRGCPVCARGIDETCRPTCDFDRVLRKAGVR